MTLRSSAAAAERLCTQAMMLLLVPPGPGARGRGRGRSRTPADRGDVPGWVMITMMTAIVVIALLTVFRKAVLDAVTSAFSSITGN